jgi:HPt (histidine-containing phosphotransfer) domain-containing protein
MIQSMIAMALEDMEPRIDAIVEAAATDAPDLAGLAHAVKGASGMVGAARVSSLAARIERAVGSGEHGPVAEQAARLREELRLFREAVEQMDWRTVV